MRQPNSLFLNCRAATMSGADYGLIEDAADVRPVQKAERRHPGQQAFIQILQVSLVSLLQSKVRPSGLTHIGDGRNSRIATLAVASNAGSVRIGPLAQQRRFR